MENIKVTLDGTSTMHLDLPITKIDEEKRIVAGFATLNNVDKHGDLIDAEGSRLAFEKFRGNIREMHMPIAVGKMVSFESRPYITDDGDTYDGIWVEAKVSKGAQDTWEKVLDGTLSGFSIGATVTTKPELKMDDGGQKYRLIKDFELFELSLVDSPANQLANVFSIQKADDGEFKMTGYLADEVEKHYDPNSLTGRASRVMEAFYDSGEGDGEYVIDVYDNFVLTQHGDKQYKVSYTSLDENVVFGERTEVETQVVITEKSEDSVIERFVDRLAEFIEKRTGGNDMSDKKTKTVEETEVDKTEEETVEKAADVSEVEVEETETSDENAEALDTDNLVNSIVEKVLERLNSVETAETDEVVTAVEDEDDEDEDEEDVEKSDDKSDDLANLIKELTSTVKSGLDTLNERVETLESSTAVKKSAEVEGDDDEDDDEDEQVEKFWGGSFTGTYISADSL